jgi:hypothetical protein
MITQKNGVLTENKHSVKTCISLWRRRRKRMKKRNGRRRRQQSNSYKELQLL